MLERINTLITENADFAFETTLASKSFLKLIEKAHNKGYITKLVFFWLNSPELAIERVICRVNEGGHNIPVEVIKRRYNRGLENFFKVYKNSVTSWIFINNSGSPYKIISEGTADTETVYYKNIWNNITGIYND